jgi:NAD(P)-dependent dehydrogenase (short-subunit alcohol dehydrogenase family)
MLFDPSRAATAPQPPALGRYLEPAEVAGLAAVLLRPEGGSVTGQQLVICGGASR